MKRVIEALLFVAVLAVGWRYPYLAYCLVLNVAVGLVGALRHGGRHGCGNFCPRGAFYSLLPDTGRKVPTRLLVSIFTLESHRFHASEPPSLCIITLWSHH